METLKIITSIAQIMGVPLSQGKPIEWKPNHPLERSLRFIVPLSQGKPIEWKHSSCSFGVVEEIVVPLSQGKLIEWKLV